MKSIRSLFDLLLKEIKTIALITLFSCVISITVFEVGTTNVVLLLTSLFITFELLFLTATALNLYVFKDVYTEFGLLSEDQTKIAPITQTES